MKFYTIRSRRVYVEATVLEEGKRIKVSGVEYRVVGFGISKTYVSEDGRFIGCQAFAKRGTLYYKRSYLVVHRGRKWADLRHDDSGRLRVTVLKALALAWGKYGDDLEIPSDIRDMSDLHGHHRDGDRSNDVASNAELLPAAEHRDEHTGRKEQRGLGLTLISLNGVISEHFPSMHAAGRFLGFPHNFHRLIQRHKQRNVTGSLVVVAKGGGHTGLKFKVVLDTAESLPGEEWKEFPYAFYGLTVRGNRRCRVLISNLGRVKRTWKMGSRIIDLKHSYMAVVHLDDKNCSLGKVMLYLFKKQHCLDTMSRTGMEFDELQCDHIDAKHPVNVVSNLQLLTPTENIRKQEGVRPVFVCKVSETLDTDVDGEHYYPCTAAAAEALSVACATIRCVVKGITKRSKIKARYVSDCVDNNN